MITGSLRYANMLAAGLMGLAGLTDQVCAEPPARFIIVTTITSLSYPVFNDEAVVADLDKHLMALCVSSFQVTNWTMRTANCQALTLVSADRTADWHGEQWQSTPRQGTYSGGIAHWYHLNPQTGDLTSCYDHARNQAAIECMTTKADLSK